MVYAFCPSVKGCLLGAWRGKPKLAHCKLVSDAEKHVTQARDAVVVPGSANGTLAIPTGSGDMAMYP